MLDLRIIADGQPLPLFDLPALLGRAEAAKELGEQIDLLIAFMDDLGGDPDEEDGDEDEDRSERSDQSWPEGEPARARQKNAAYHEDAEADGDEQDHNFSEEDFIQHADDGPGCRIGDQPEDSTWVEGIDQTDAMRAFADGDAEILDRKELHPHRDFIRRTRCGPPRGAWSLYQLPSGKGHVFGMERI